MKSTITEDTYRAIILEWNDGMRCERIADKHGLSTASVYRITKADEAAREGNVEHLRMIARTSLRVAELAAQMHGLSLSGPTPEAPAVPAVQDNTATAVVRVLQLLEELVQSTKDVGVALQGISTEMSALRMAVAGLRKDANERLDKATESINVNGDILTKEHDKIIDLMGAIKMNTKKLPAVLRSSD